ncbi:MAG: hypothetical protein H6563_15515 [Lewinellaceae bacterium]|nr:hypothetical protein [Lewinellaceae bacterium]
MLRKIAPHLVAYLILMAVTFVFFAPYVFEGKVLQQSDNLQSRGMQTELREYKEKTGHYPLWTNSMFSGMPAYQIFYVPKSALLVPFRAALLGNSVAPPHTGILLMMAGMYFLLVVLRIDWRIAVVGAIGFGLSANFMDLALTGHSTKIVALAWMGPVFAGPILAFRGKRLLGAGVLAVALGLQLLANHIQITYYTLLMLGLMGIVYLIQAIRDKQVPDFLKTAGILVLAGGLAFASSIGRLWTTWEYSQETIRGKSELTQKEGSSGSMEGEGGGLSKDYAFGWSYGIPETFTLLIPNYMGGSSNENFVADRNSATLKALQRLGNQEQAESLVPSAAHYWGTQPFTGGPVYFGAVLWLLFFLGIFLAKSPLKPWIITGVTLTIIMAWGRNFPAFNYWIFDHLPMYNKFRAVTMVFGITCSLVIIMGMLGLQAFFDKSIAEATKKRALLLAGGTTAGILVLAWLLSLGFDYGASDPNLPASVAEALRSDRAALLSADLWRSFILVALAFGVLFARTITRIAPQMLVVGIGILVLFDMWTIGRRFISDKDFVEKTKITQFTQPQPVDEQIMQDPDPYFRVADLRQNPFSNALTSYHHKSIGGYHAAKLMRYQELIERYLSDPGRYGNIYSMLNTKYFILRNGQASLNPDALGNAWFVKSYEIVPNGDAEMAALATLKPGEKAVIQESFKPKLEGFNLQYDSTATIQLTSYNPDTMVYRYSAQSEQLAVFSEVYYPPSKGWQLYVDGEPLSILKADFLLRAARVPAGQNRELKMIFAPKSYYIGETITLIASLVALALGLFGAYSFFRKYGIPEPAHLPEEENPQPTARKTTTRVKKKK